MYICVGCEMKNLRGNNVYRKMIEKQNIQVLLFVNFVVPIKYKCKLTVMYKK